MAAMQGLCHLNLSGTVANHLLISKVVLNHGTGKFVQINVSLCKCNKNSYHLGKNCVYASAIMFSRLQKALHKHYKDRVPQLVAPLRCFHYVRLLRGALGFPVLPIWPIFGSVFRFSHL